MNALEFSGWLVDFGPVIYEFEKTTRPTRLVDFQLAQSKFGLIMSFNVFNSDFNILESFLYLFFV